MTPEELLKPRYKVIADWPGNKIKVGSVSVAADNRCAYFDHILYHISMLDMHPHLFRKLEWHDDVKWQDLPKYLKFIKEDGEIDFVLKVEKYINVKDAGKWWAFEYKWQNEPDIKRMSLQGWTPATEEEYLNTIKPH